MELEFAGKKFNGVAFLKYMETVADTRVKKFLTSGAVYTDEGLAIAMQEQTGTNIVAKPIFARITGEPTNYDGKTDIEAYETGTYIQNYKSLGRAVGFLEKDFSQDITGGVDFMDNVGKQVKGYWDDIRQGILLSTMKGIYSMTDAKGKTFVEGHTLKTGKPINAVTVNVAIQKFLGDNKNAFSLAIMHSRVATTLENLKVLQFLTYTDKDGIEVPTDIAYINGKLVLIDDTMPFDAKTGEYTTYIFGRDTICLTPLSTKVPIEVDRNATKNGGEEKLITRIRMVLGLWGFSWVGDASIVSPTLAELETGSNWSLVANDKGAIDLKTIKIGRIITKEDGDSLLETPPINVKIVGGEVPPTEG